MKIFLILTICILIILSPSGSIGALTLTTRANVSVDESLIKDNNLYSSPEEILLTPIAINKDLALTENEWYKGIYYYTVDRLGFSDMPYHYLVTESGIVYKGNKFGDEKQIPLTDFNSNSIIVAYLHRGNSTSIDPRAETNLKELILQIGNYNNINPSKTSIRNLRFKRDKNLKTIEVIAEKTFGNWETSLARIVNSISGFSPLQKDYSAEVLEVTVPTEEVTPGDEITVSMRIKNTSQSGNYADSNSELILSKVTSGSSAFYINNVWLSQTQTGIMTEGQNFLPGQEARFDFKVRVPLYVGEISEGFELRTFSGAKVQNANVEIKLKVKRTDKQIVQIKNNSAGFSNVYYQPYTSSGVALRATQGERYFLLEQNTQTLWARIDLGNGQSGWIAVWNLTFL